MNRCLLRQSVGRFVAVASLVLLWASLTCVAQTATPTPAKKLPLPPLPKAKTVTPPKPSPTPAAAATQSKPANNPATQPAANSKEAMQKKEEARKAEERKAAERKAEEQRKAANAATTSGTSATSGATSLPGTIGNAAGQPASNLVAPSDATAAANATNGAAAGSTTNSRAPVGMQGVGDFTWAGGWLLTAYGCYRSGTRLFCDFDTTNQHNQQANSNIWSGAGGVNVVDDGGKLTPRHNAFFVGTDGSQFNTAYISPQPVRFVIEYDDIDQRYTSISLVLGGNRIQSVPIMAMEASQPAGKMPARGSAAGAQPAGTQPAGTQQSASTGNTGILDKATNAANNANNQKQKAQDLLKSLPSQH